MWKGRTELYVNAVWVSLRQSGATVAVSGSILVGSCVNASSYPNPNYNAISNLTLILTADLQMIT